MKLKPFIFAIWASVGTAAATTTACLAIAASQYTTSIISGKTLVSSSINGQQFSFSTTKNMSSDELVSLAHSAWVLVKDMTDAELVAYLSKKNSPATIVSFANAQI